MIRILLLIFCANALATGCGKSSESSQGFGAGILGGQELPSNKFLAALRLRTSPQEIHCSAALIAPKVLITAAHCLFVEGKRLATSDLEVVFDLNVRSSKTLPLEKILPHPNYRPSRAEDACAFGPCPPDDEFGEWLANDVALLILEGEAPPSVRPFVLPPMNPGLKTGDPVSVAGYGFNTPLTEISGDPSQSGTAKILMTTLLLQINGFDTREKFHKLYIPGTATEAACFGDSGGPLFSGEILLGVLSHSARLENGFGCGNHLSAYTDISYSLPWIEEAMRTVK